MVLESLVDAVAAVVLVVGLPLLIVLFYLEGLILGKILQPPAVFVTVVAIAQPETFYLIFLCGGCTMAVVVGQWTTFRSFDPNAPRFFGLPESWPRLEALPSTILDRIGDRRLEFIDRLFVRYGAGAVFVTTYLPVIRGLLAVPAGMSAYPSGRFLAVTILANVLYFPILVAVAFGILLVIGI